MIGAIANAIATTEGCNLVDVDPGLSTNRTVYTFLGSPEAVVEGALNGARAAAQLIDMTRHSGGQNTHSLLPLFYVEDFLLQTSYVDNTCYIIYHTQISCTVVRYSVA